MRLPAASRDEVSLFLAWIKQPLQLATAQDTAQCDQMQLKDTAFRNSQHLLTEEWLGVSVGPLYLTMPFPSSDRCFPHQLFKSAPNLQNGEIR